MIFTILIGAGIFNYFIDSTGLTDALVKAVGDLGHSRWMIMFLLMVMYIVLGALMDELAMMLLTVGPVFKLIVALGFDPIWFGVMFVTVCEIGMIVPPVGINLFVIQGAGSPLQTIGPRILPFVVADCFRMLIISRLQGARRWATGFPKRDRIQRPLSAAQGYARPHIRCATGGAPADRPNERLRKRVLSN